MKAETEAKIEVADLEPIRRRLGELRAVMVRSGEELNIYYDRAGELAGRRESLRLRQAAEIRLTWKGPTSYESGIVNRPEIELTVDDVNQCDALLHHLGFEIVGRLEKRRAAWTLGAVEVALDELAFGTFVELEGPIDEVGMVAAALGLDVSRGRPESYRQLQAERKP